MERIFYESTKKLSFCFDILLQIVGANLQNSKLYIHDWVLKIQEEQENEDMDKKKSETHNK